LLTLLGGAGVLVWKPMAVRPVEAVFRDALAGALLLSGLVCWLGTGLTVWGERVGRFRLRDGLLGRVKLGGDEIVLDVGCGRGLLTVGAARQLTTGFVVGLDQWQWNDGAPFSGGPEALFNNAQAEGVMERIVLKTADYGQLPYPAGSVDVVVSGWALHKIADRRGREQALREMARVLKPGGRLAILDDRGTSEYEDVLIELGLADVRRSGPAFLSLRPTYQLTARKPKL
jgi:SAM-dependent methyltransferase